MGCIGVDAAVSVSIDMGTFIEGRRAEGTSTTPAVEDVEEIACVVVVEAGVAAT
jgi:hypothetical protein